MPALRKSKKVAVAKRKRALHPTRALRSSSAPRTNRKVAPARKRRSQTLSQRLTGVLFASLDRTQILLTLSEFLAVEHSSILLYGEALTHAKDPEIGDPLEVFHDQVRHQARLLENAIRELGGSISMLSQGAVVQQQRADATLHLEVAPGRRLITDLENLLLNETQSRFSWDLLRTMIPFVEDRGTHALLQEIYDEFERREEERLGWVKRTLSRLMIESMLAEAA